MDTKETREYLATAGDGHAEGWAWALDVLESADAPEETREEAEETLDVLAVKRYQVLEFAVTIGGPNVYLNVTIDPEGDVTGVEWEAHWGGQSHKRDCARGSREWRYAEYMAERWAEAQG